MGRTFTFALRSLRRMHKPIYERPGVVVRDLDDYVLTSPQHANIVLTSRPWGTQSF